MNSEQQISSLYEYIKLVATAQLSHGTRLAMERVCYSTQHKQGGAGCGMWIRAREQ